MRFIVTDNWIAHVFAEHPMEFQQTFKQLAVEIQRQTIKMFTASD
jgi:hypothetical protein